MPIMFKLNAVRMESGERIGDYLGTALTAARVAAADMAQVRADGIGAISYPDAKRLLDRASEELQQALEELDAVRAQLAYHASVVESLEAGN